MEAKRLRGLGLSGANRRRFGALGGYGAQDVRLQGAGAWRLDP